MTTFDGRRPLMENNLQLKMTIDGRRPLMEDDHFISVKIVFSNMGPKSTFSFVHNYSCCLVAVMARRTWPVYTLFVHSLHVYNTVYRVSLLRTKYWANIITLARTLHYRYLLSTLSNFPFQKRVFCPKFFERNKINAICSNKIKTFDVLILF